MNNTDKTPKLPSFKALNYLDFGRRLSASENPQIRSLSYVTLDTSSFKPAPSIDKLKSSFLSYADTNPAVAPRPGTQIAHGFGALESPEFGQPERLKDEVLPAHHSLRIAIEMERNNMAKQEQAQSLAPKDAAEMKGSTANKSLSLGAWASCSRTMSPNSASTGSKSAMQQQMGALTEGSQHQQGPIYVAESPKRGRPSKSPVVAAAVAMVAARGQTADGFSCPFCRKAFPSMDKLKVHLRTHDGVKPYKCDQCEKSFARLDKLIFHERTHSGFKPFVCPLCSKAFSRPDKLKNHEKTHLGKPVKYFCSVCSRGFAAASSLKTHMKSHAKEAAAGSSAPSTVTTPTTTQASANSVSSPRYQLPQPPASRGGAMPMTNTLVVSSNSGFSPSPALDSSRIPSSQFNTNAGNGAVPASAAANVARALQSYVQMFQNGAPPM